MVGAFVLSKKEKKTKLKTWPFTQEDCLFLDDLRDGLEMKWNSQENLSL